MGTCIFTKSFTIHYWLKKIQFTHVLSFWALGQMSHMKYSILCCKDIIHRFFLFVNANAKILFFHFLWKFTFSWIFSENSISGWKFSRAVWGFDFCENAQFWVGIFVSLIQETTKMKNAGKNLSFLLTKCGFWYIIGVVSTG